MTISYLSVFSGIEAWSVACKGLDYHAVGFSEIDPFASAVLAARFGSNLPGQPLSHNAPPNFGDVTKIPLDKIGRVDLLVGGSPCQAFSFAGKRLSLADVRGNLTLAYAVLAHELARSHGCRNALWENVPGVLSTDDNAFGCFLGALVGADDALLPSPKPAGKRGNDLWTFSKELGDIRPAWPNAGMVAGPRARAAWRVLDAQYFGLAQRRERVFVVVDFGNGADPAAVLFEPQGLRGNSPPRREAGQAVAATVTASTGGCSGKDGIDGRLAYGGGNRSGPVEVAATLTAKGQKCDFEVETFIAGPAHTLRGEGFDASEDGTGRGTPLVPVYAIQERAVSENPNAGPQGKGWQPDIGYTLEARHHVQAVAFDATQITSKANRSNPKAGDPCHPLAAQGHPPAIAFDARQSDVLIYGDMTGPLDTDGSSIGVAVDPSPATAYRTSSNNGAWSTGDKVDALTTGTDRTSHLLTHGWAVRRLTPTETARLQGFPDDHCRIPWRGKPAEECPDGPQYKTHGNSMAVKNMRWLAERIERLLMRGTP